MMDPSRSITNITIILASPTAPSSRVRYGNLVSALSDNGVNATLELYPNNLFKRIQLFRRCRNSDLVVLQKKLLSPLQLKLLRFSSKMLAYDFDDAVYLRYNHGRSEVSTGRKNKFRRTLQICDFVIAGNSALARQAATINNTVSIIPSSVAVTGIVQKDYSQPTSEPIVIGWVGTAENLPYLQLLSPTLKKLGQEFSLELRIICNDTITMAGVRIHYIPWLLQTQEHEIAQFDIGVMPLPDSEHAAGKCGYKALQYMAAAVPAVASDVGVNSEIITDGEDGLIAAHIEDFYQKLKYLIEHPGERQRIGIAGRRRVERDFSIEVVGKQLAETLKAVAAGQAR